jgi:hypothetical protein
MKAQPAQPGSDTPSPPTASNILDALLVAMSGDPDPAVAAWAAALLQGEKASSEEVSRA